MRATGVLRQFSRDGGHAALAQQFLEGDAGRSWRQAGAPNRPCNGRCHQMAINLPRLASIAPGGEIG
jgi:hypothetical protein